MSRTSKPLLTVLTFRESPDLLDADKEYNMEKILDSRLTRNKWDVEYLIKWLDYSSSKNTWEPVSGLTKALDKIADFHKAHPKAYKKSLPRLQGLGV